LKLLFFDDYRLGVLKGDTVVDVGDVVKDIPHLQPQDLIKGLIEQWDAYKGKLESAVASGSGKPLGSVNIRPPLPKPNTIACMAVNYLENHTLPQPAPINAFLKSGHCVIGDGDTMVLPDIPASVFEGEAEMAVVIGKRASNVSRDDAMSYVFGYVNFIDGSARGVIPANNSFYQMKSRDTFAPIGPFIVTADEVTEPHNIQIRLWNNGQLMQDFNTDDMGNDIPRCIEFITSAHPLEAGDILATGTNHRGLHAFQDGDRIELEVEGMGRLHINVRDDLKRQWPRETRLDRLEAARARGENAGYVGSPSVQTGGKYTPAEAPKA
jgi:2-keto-4-pentenoate hydratase/2-oxohepta-3-ene-1,7-dioic acid hydratase in catechol pathway